jgi:hypothetical protein
MLTLLDKAFFAFHAGWIGFNLVGWAWRRTRPFQLVTLGLTAFSWFVLGAFYGWGYCLCTDWHFRVRRQLGHVDPESSYVQMLLNRVFGITLDRPTSDRLTMGVFAAIVIATAVVWSRDRRSARADHGTTPEGSPSSP